MTQDDGCGQRSLGTWGTRKRECGSKFRESLIKPPHLSVNYYLHNVVRMHKCLKAVVYYRKYSYKHCNCSWGPRGSKL